MVTFILSYLFLPAEDEARHYRVSVRGLQTFILVARSPAGLDAIDWNFAKFKPMVHERL